MPLFLLLGIMLLGTYLRLEGIGAPSLWYDELFTVRASTSSLESVVPETLASRHLPLYYLALHFWSLLGAGDAWVRLLSAAAGIATIGLVYGIGSSLFSRRAGLWGAAFAAFSPFLVWYSRDATDYSFAVAATMASLFFMVRALRGQGWINWGLYVVASAAALFTHYYAILFLAAEIPLFLLLQKSDSGKLRPWLICQGILGALLVPWLLMASQTGATRFYGEGGMPHFGSVLKAMGTAPIIFIKGYSGAVGRGEAALTLSKGQITVLIIGFLGAVVLTVAAQRLVRTSYKRNLAALSIFSFLTLAMPVFFHLSQGNLIAGRYYAVAAPVFFLLLASLTNLLSPKLALLTGGLMILLMILFLGQQRQIYDQEDWRMIMNIVALNKRDGDEILCFPLHHCVAARDYYVDPSAIPIKGGTITINESDSIYLFPTDFVWNSYRSPFPAVSPTSDITELKLGLDSSLAATERIWLVSGTGNLGNYPKATGVEQALSSVWNLQDEWDFTPLSLKLYERKK